MNGIIKSNKSHFNSSIGAMMNHQQSPSSSSMDCKIGIKDGRKMSSFYEEFKIDLKQATEKIINCVHFCSFESAPNILACCAQERIFIYRILLPNKDGSGEFKAQFIYDYICGSKCTTIALGPKTNFPVAQEGFLSLAVATDDFCTLVLNQVISEISNEEAEQQFFTGHINHINDIAFEPITGDYLASTGDDCTCIIRSLNETDNNNGNKNDLSTKIMLTSAGVTVKWHKTEPNKLFVAEKKGLIRFYDIITRVAVMSFDCNRYPLTSSDWCCENNLLIGCASDKDLFFWDTSLTSLPFKIMKTNYEGLSEFAFYDNKLMAFRGRPNNFLNVKNFLTNQTYIEKEFVAGHGISWNRNIPLLAVGGPKFVRLYKFNIF